MLLRVRSEGVIFGTDGQPVKSCSSVVYLGGLLSSDGRSAAEVARRVGEARGVFDQFARVWSHANIPRHRKKEIVDALVVPKLLYGLESLLLYKADRDKIDSFYCRCLRQIHQIHTHTFLV